MRKLKLRESGAWLSHAHCLDALATDPAFADHFSAMLLGTGFDALFWECPPLDRTRLDDPFECVITDSPALARMRGDPDAFREHFHAAGDVAVFDNLGGDATLVAPAPAGSSGFTHLAAFCRRASRDLQRAFWVTLAQAVMQRLGTQPLWVSTSGLGIGWLHARLDTRPKYYTHAPYRRWSA